MLPSFGSKSDNNRKRPTRNLAAPQINHDHHQSHAIHAITVEGKSVPLNTNGSEDVDFRSHKFDPLEDFSTMIFRNYVGPTPESNWVIPGKLLVGAYPASKDDYETYHLLTSILKYGVSKFVCLQQEYRAHGVTEDMWRNGSVLRPYFEDVKQIVSQPDKFSMLLQQEDNIPSPESVSFVHFPIKDCGITDDDRVIELSKSLVKTIAKGEVMYLHCWGGHGRTGTIVSIMLHLMYNLSAKEAMARCQKVHDMREYPVDVGSPQTQQQRDQVVRVIKKLSIYQNSSSSPIGSFMHNLLVPSSSAITNLLRTTQKPQEIDKDKIEISSTADSSHVDENDNGNNQNSNEHEHEHQNQHENQQGNENQNQNVIDHSISLLSAKTEVPILMETENDNNSTNNSNIPVISSKSEISDITPIMEDVEDIEEDQEMKIDGVEDFVSDRDSLEEFPILVENNFIREVIGSDGNDSFGENEDSMNSYKVNMDIENNTDTLRRIIPSIKSFDRVENEKQAKSLLKTTDHSKKSSSSAAVVVVGKDSIRPVSPTVKASNIYLSSRIRHRLSYPPPDPSNTTQKFSSGSPRPKDTTSHNMITPPINNTNSYETKRLGVLPKATSVPFPSRRNTLAAAASLSSSSVVGGVAGGGIGDNHDQKLKAPLTSTPMPPPHSRSPVTNRNFRKPPLQQQSSNSSTNGGGGISSNNKSSSTSSKSSRNDISRSVSPQIHT